MLGVVGFDGGTKNAIALAIPPPGTTTEPEERAPSGPSGACCYDDGSCTVQTELDCDNAGGTYQGDDTDCAPTGACCIGTDCSITTETCCTGAGGTYQGDDTTCDPNPCSPPPTGACCVDGVCSETTEAECFGTYYGDGSSCDTVDCSAPPDCQPPLIWCLDGAHCCNPGLICCHGSSGSRCCTEKCCPDGHCCRSSQFCCPDCPGGCGLTSACCGGMSPLGAFSPDYINAVLARIRRKAA